ncbi:hypothetical protein GBA52_008347 [Prunus armeniaca]|nr:hypothetical protein GBA52_008347 [Prunus armeniaca]
MRQNRSACKAINSNKLIQAATRKSPMVWEWYDNPESECHGHLEQHKLCGGWRRAGKAVST